MQQNYERSQQLHINKTKNKAKNKSDKYLEKFKK